MITIVLTYRNRDLSILKRCLNSLNNQSNHQFKVVLVNYGSLKEFEIELNKIAGDFLFLKIINCSTQGQLWCKSKAINIALKECETPYFFVGDVDMIFHPEFISKLDEFKRKKTVTYFQVGFLSEEESAIKKEFKAYVINFKSSLEATGMTLFNTDDLMSINGFDEFYHGWGSEDTDVHIRLKNAGFKVDFYDKEILLLHQWHPKQYRTKQSLEPFHSHMEQINHAYMEFTKLSKLIKANVKFGFGIYKDSDYVSLKSPDLTFRITNRRDEVKGFINNVKEQEQKVVKVIITVDSEYKSIKQNIKKILGKKTIPFLSMYDINDLLLEQIVMNYRYCPYVYRFNRHSKSIDLTIKLND